MHESWQLCRGRALLLRVPWLPELCLRRNQLLLPNVPYCAHQDLESFVALECSNIPISSSSGRLLVTHIQPSLLYLITHHREDQDYNTERISNRVSVALMRTIHHDEQHFHYTHTEDFGNCKLSWLGRITNKDGEVRQMLKELSTATYGLSLGIPWRHHFWAQGTQMHRRNCHSRERHDRSHRSAQS